MKKFLILSVLILSLQGCAFSLEEGQVSNFNPKDVQTFSNEENLFGLKTKDEQFAKNMELSLLRANAVAQYAILKTSYDKANSEKLRKMLVVEGKSFSDPVIVDGKEDYNKSRRVELKLRVKARNFAQIFGLNFGND